MKNPYMSLWLSAANKAAGPMRGAWMAEMSRQQKAFAKEMTKAWVSGLGASMAGSGRKPRRK